MKFRTFAPVATCLLLMSASTSMASTVSDHFSFSIPSSSFDTIPGDLPLSGNVSLSFDITFDPSLTYADTTLGLSHVVYSGAVDTAVGFDTNQIGSGYLVVGGTGDGVPTIESTPFHTNDFYIHIANITTNPTFQQFGFSTASGNTLTGQGNYYSTPTNMDGTSAAAGVDFSFGPVTSVSSVPLPGGLPLFGAALVALAGVGVLKSGRKAGKPDQTLA